MYLKTRTWFLVSLICLLGAIYFWQLGNKRAAQQKKEGSTELAPPGRTNAVVPLLSTSGTPDRLKPGLQTNAVTGSTDTNAPFPYRISNTVRKINELVRSDSAILLRNALIDTTSGAPLQIPAHLRSQGDPGSYIVQSRGTTTDAFREALRSAGAEIVSYVPNNAYLVRASAAAITHLRTLPQVQFVAAWEPYFKLAPKLLELAVEQKALPDGNPLSILTFPNEADIAERQLQELGGIVLRRHASPFGTQLVVHTPSDRLVAVAQLAPVQAIEPAYRRVLATDLARTRVNVSSNTITPNNHLGLTGSGIRVGVNDTGVDENHPGLQGRVSGDPAGVLRDEDGHGTHVAAILAGNGANAPNGTNVPGSTNGASFRGMAHQARVFAQPIDILAGPLKSDSELQQVTATNDIFISNNSWGYLGAFDYTFAAAEWDAAVRDSVPGQAGSQAVTYVFSAGNEGLGNASGGGGFEDTVHAPGTAKNVITVGATEQFRNITNEVLLNCETNMAGTNETVTCETNRPFLRITDSDNQVASFSSRGNVGVDVEGPFGRFKPDVVAPGVFLVSARTMDWKESLNISLSTSTFRDEVIPVGATNYYAFFADPNARDARIRVVPNGRSPIPFPTNSIYVRRGAPPPPSDYVAPSNSLNIKPLASDVYYLGVGNNFNQDVHCDVQIVVVNTNPPTVASQELIALNQDLEPYYRYESGTSMAAPVVSGVLALMEQHLNARGINAPTPALMKALLINGARSLLIYDVQVDKRRNFQGWGMVNITNSLPLFSVGTDPSAWPVRVFDQTNGLTTGQSITRTVTMNSNAADLRITLVWTDPPGNPAVGSKLVNDLDIIVTNLNTLGRPGGPEVFVGNVIQPGGQVSIAVPATNIVTDVINNVENVLIPNPLAGTSYSVTVRARHVNVNAVTAHTPTGIAQDFALVISSGNPARGPVFSVSQSPPTIGFQQEREVITLTNDRPVLDIRVGANPPFWAAPNTNGFTNQWRFFVFENTNTVNNTNVGFFTFLTPNLSRVRQSHSADIDLYVSTDFRLTNLHPAVIGTAASSTLRGGTEAVTFSNATDRFYYIGVKSEDQQAATFGLFPHAGPVPFSDRDSNGVVVVNLIAVPTEIGDGSSERASVVRFVGRAPEIEVRNVVVTNTLTHGNGGDLIGILEHTQPDGVQRSSVLNNHRDFKGEVTFIWDDSDSGQILDAMPTDPPGTLRNFWGRPGGGPWMLLMIDDAMVETGSVQHASIRLEPRKKADDDTVITTTILPNRWFYTFVDVPPDAVLLGIDVVPDIGPVEIYAGRNFVPTQTNYDHTARFGPPGGSLEITPSDSPPLSPGTYFIGLFNPNAAALTVNMYIRIERNPFGNVTNRFAMSGTNLLDDAVTTALLTVTNSQRIVDVRTGVRIQHQRASDLVLTLISPQGTRVLLAENRGGDSARGYGAGSVPPDAEYTYTVFTESTNLTVTPIKFGTPPFTNSTCVTNIVPGRPVLANSFEGAPCDTVFGVGEYVSGWEVEAGDIDTACSSLAHTGIEWIDLNGGEPGVISTNVATMPGTDYQLSFAYCRNPQGDDPDFVASCDVEVGGLVIANVSYGLPNTDQDLNWSTTSMVFRATSATTTLRMRSTVPSGNEGMYLDSFTVSPLITISNSCNYFFPEESLKQFQGENPYGTWRLEIWDNRVGAPLGDLLAWQLDFDFVNTNSPAIALTNAGCINGVAYGTNPVYFRVQVPFVATGATNTLFSPSSAFMVLGADIDMLPLGLQPPDDYTPVINNLAVLVITNTSNPPLPNGRSYYLSVQNTNALQTNDFTLCVEFDAGDTNDFSAVPEITPLLCITNTIPVTNLLDYYVFNVDSNAVELAFELRNLSMAGNVDMVINQGLPLPNSQSFYAQSAQPGTADDIINITNYNGGLGGPWYIGIYNSSNSPVNYSLCVREVIGVNYVNIDVCTNGATIPANSVRYFRHTVSPIALRSHFTVSNIMGGNIDMFVSDFPPQPPPSSQRHLIAGTNPGTDDELAALSLASTPQLVPGATYFIAITNHASVGVTYNLCIFDFPSFVPLADGICAKNTLVHSNDAHYFVFTVGNDAVRADFQTLGATGDVDLYLRQFPIPGPFPGEYDYASANMGTGDEHIVLTTNGMTFPPLAPGDWYLVVVNRAPGLVNYCIQATQTPAIDIKPITCTNAATIPAYSVQYYDYAVSPDALRVLFQVTNITASLGPANVDMYVGTNAFPGPMDAMDSSTNPGNADEHIAHSRAFLLNPPMTYRIAITNLEAVDVTYSLCVIETTNFISLVNNVCSNNTLYASGRRDAQYYSFNVADNAVQAEFSTASFGDVDLYLRRVPTPGLPASEHDYAEANAGVGNELIVIHTNSAPVPLAPGLWYLMVTAQGDAVVDYCVKVRQHVVEDLTAQQCDNNVTIAPYDVRYYQFMVPSDAFQVAFEARSLTQDLDMYVNPSSALPLPGETNYTKASVTRGKDDEYVVFSSASMPQLQAPGTYFIAITNVTDQFATFRLCAYLTTNGMALTNNGVCVTNTFAMINDGPYYQEVHYYQVTIFSNSVRADFMTLQANGDVDLYIRDTVPPAPGPTSFDYRSTNPGTSNEMIVVTTTNSPPLTPGDWYIAVVNRQAGPVTYCMKVSQYPVLDPFNIRLRITNGWPTHMDLGWNAFEFQRFYLEWAPTLTTPWQPFTNLSGPIEFGPVGGMGTNFHHRDQPLMGPMRFYRLNILP
jgi:subtilisin family serine protease/subtilisin-like proprotein convertase family protein